MSIIIPYKEKELYDNEGAFIKPDGEIIYTYGLHESFSSKYCNGDLYDFLYRCIYPDSFKPQYDNTSLSELFEYLQEEMQIFGM